jgi:hypothetical protein
MTFRTSKLRRSLVGPSQYNLNFGLCFRERTFLFPNISNQGPIYWVQDPVPCPLFHWVGQRREGAPTTVIISLFSTSYKRVGHGRRSNAWLGGACFLWDPLPA